MKSIPATGVTSLPKIPAKTGNTAPVGSRELCLAQKRMGGGEGREACLKKATKVSLRFISCQVLLVSIPVNT